MINRLNNYRSLAYRDKILLSAQFLADFNKSYQVAQNAKTKLEEIYEKIVQLQSKPAASRVHDQNADKLHSELDHRTADAAALVKATSASSLQGFKQGSSLADLQSKEHVYSSSFAQGS